jgi:hypothetical protein
MYIRIIAESNMNPTKTRGRTQVLRKGDHPSCYSCNNHGDESRMRKGPGNYIYVCHEKKLTNNTSYS